MSPILLFGIQVFFNSNILNMSIIVLLNLNALKKKINGIQNLF